MLKSITESHPHMLLLEQERLSIAGVFMQQAKRRAHVGEIDWGSRIARRVYVLRHHWAYSAVMHVALLALVGDAVAARVDDHARVGAGRGRDRVAEHARVVVVVVRAVPLAEAVARVGAARVADVVAVDAVEALGAQLAERLVVGDVGREAAQRVEHAEARDARDEVVEVVLPAEPAAVPRVEVE